MNLGRLCRFSKICPAYSGKVTINETPLLLHRNVFCNRGYKGWKNCELYDSFEKSEEE